MNKVTGVVEAKAKNGRSFKVGDDWFSCYNADDLNDINKGDEVSFEYKENGNWKNVQGKPSKVGGSQPAQQQPQQAPAKAAGKSFNGGANVGIEVGHAINNAVAIAVAEGDTSIGNIEKIAGSIYTMGQRLRQQAVDGTLGKEVKQEQRQAPADDTPVSDDFDDVPF